MGCGNVNAPGKDPITLAVYFVGCPEHGPEHRLYTLAEIRQIGGIDALHRQLAEQVQWFMNVGEIMGIQDASGVTFPDSDVFRAPPTRKRLGRRHPCFGCHEEVQQLYELLSESISNFVSFWKYCDGDGVEYRYLLKNLAISGDEVELLSSTLRSLSMACTVIRASIIRYWGSVSLAPTDDVIDAEYTLSFPVIASSREGVISVEVVQCHES